MELPSAEGSWVERYYEALEFLYWEPQHLGRKKFAGAEFDSLAKVQHHIRKIEVTLNHLLTQFFSLAPVSFRNRLFESVLGCQMPGEFRMASRDCDNEFQLQNSTQPDFLFVTPNTSVSMEMKIDSKTSLEQVLKYALLALAVEMQNGKEMEHYLIFLGRGGFSNLWEANGRFASTDSVHAVLCEDSFRQSLHVFMKGRPKRFHDHAARYCEIIASLSIGYLSYSKLADSLRSEIKPSEQNAHEHVYKSLVDGMVGELEQRGLTAS